MEILDHSRVVSGDQDWTPSELKVDQVPIPTKIPKPPNLEMLPSHILRSGAIESLMGQNDDLLARLKVSVAKNAQMEEKLHQKDMAHESMEFQYHQMEDHLKIVRAKERLIMQRTQDTDSQFESLKEEIYLHEIRFSELHATSESRIRKVQYEFDRMALRLRCLAKYRRLTSPLVHQLKKHFQKTKESAAYFESELNSQREQAETNNSGLSLRLKESVDYIQTQGLQHKHELDQAQVRFEENHNYLTSTYEDRLDNLDQKLATVESEKEDLNERVIEQFELKNKINELDNEIIYHKRNFQELKTTSDESLQVTQESLGKYRNDAKFKILECERNSKQIAELTESNKIYSTGKAEQLEQVESLQALWQHQQINIDKLTEKNQSLQKLNQQLSTSMNANRKTISDLRSQKESAQWQFGRQVQRLEAEIKTIRNVELKIPQDFVETVDAIDSNPEGSPSVNQPSAAARDPQIMINKNSLPKVESSTPNSSPSRVEMILAEIKSCYGAPLRRNETDNNNDSNNNSNDKPIAHD